VEFAGRCLENCGKGGANVEWLCFDQLRGSRSPQQITPRY